MRPTPIERLFRHNTQMSPGTLGGRWRSAAPVRSARSAAGAYRTPPTPGSKPYATVVVAASNSVAPNATSADYVCDGTADEVELQAALDAVDAAGGGRVLCLEGLFSFTDDIIMADMARITLEGQGPGTVFKIANSVTPFVTLLDIGASPAISSDIVIRNICFDGNQANNSSTTHRAITNDSGGRFSIENCVFLNWQEHCIGFKGTQTSRIVDCDFSCSAYASYAVRFQQGGSGNLPQRVLVSGCSFVAADATTVGYGIAMDSSMDGATVMGCSFTGFIEQVGMTSGGNGYHHIGNQHFGPCDIAIFLSHPLGCVISDNRFDGVGTTGNKAAIYLDNGSYYLVADNDFYDVHGFGLYMIQVSDSAIQGNMFSGVGTGTNNSFDCIFLSNHAGSDRNVFSNNVFRDGGFGNKARYGIRIDGSAADDNLVVLNDLKNLAAASAAISDVGTGTLFNLDGSANNWNRT